MFETYNRDNSSLIYSLDKIRMQIEKLQDENDDISAAFDSLKNNAEYVVDMLDNIKDAAKNLNKFYEENIRPSELSEDFEKFDEDFVGLIDSIEELSCSDEAYNIALC